MAGGSEFMAEGGGLMAGGGGFNLVDASPTRALSRRSRRPPFSFRLFRPNACLRISPPIKRRGDSSRVFGVLSASSPLLAQEDP
eukprot:686058-Pyramimonas_sp.AAC.1